MTCTSICGNRYIENSAICVTSVKLQTLSIADASSIDTHKES